MKRQFRSVPLTLASETSTRWTPLAHGPPWSREVPLACTRPAGRRFSPLRVRSVSGGSRVQAARARGCCLRDLLLRGCCCGCSCSRRPPAASGSRSKAPMSQPLALRAGGAALVDRRARRRRPPRRSRRCRRSARACRCRRRCRPAERARSGVLVAVGGEQARLAVLEVVALGRR